MLQAAISVLVRAATTRSFSSAAISHILRAHLCHKGKEVINAGFADDGLSSSPGKVLNYDV
jgi:hypothetical protein